MVVSNPAQPSTDNEATTQNESAGGFFTDTNGVGIDLSGVRGAQGPTGPAGNGIDTVTFSPDPTQVGVDTVVTITYTDGSDPTVLTIPAGTMGTAGTDVIPVFFTADVIGPDGLPDSISNAGIMLVAGNTHYSFVRSNNELVFPDGTFSFGQFSNEVENGRIGFAPLTAGQGEPGADGVSFVDVFFEAGFNPLSGSLNRAINPSLTFRMFGGSNVAHDYRAFLRSDDTAYFTDGDLTTFNVSNFETAVENGEFAGITSILRGERGDIGPQGPDGDQGPSGDTLVPVFFTETLDDRFNPPITRFSDVDTIIQSDNTHLVYFAASDDQAFPNGWSPTVRVNQFHGTSLSITDASRVAQLENLINSRSIPTHQLGTEGPAGPMGLRGLAGPAGTDGDTYIPVYFINTNGVASNGTLTLSDAVNSLAYVPLSDTSVFPDGSVGSFVASAFIGEVNAGTRGFHDLGAEGEMGAQGPAGDTYVPVYYNPTGSRLTFDASLNVEDADTHFAYAPLSNSIIFTQGTLASFSAQGFALELQNTPLSGHMLGERGQPGEQGPQGDQGEIGPQGDQGPQGNFDLNIYTRAATAPTATPVGGSYNPTDGTLTPPPASTSGGVTWFAQIPTGTDDLYTSRARFNAVTGVLGNWSIPFNAGAMGPAGPQGPEGISELLTIFYSTDGTRDTAVSADIPNAYTGQEYIGFDIHTEDTSAQIPMQFIRFVGEDGEFTTWDPTRTYRENDQVLFLDPNRNPSLYISRTNGNLNNRPVSTGGAADFTNWDLIRSGITILQTNGLDNRTGVTDTGEGISANSTLHINEGTGITVSRQQTEFIISVDSTVGGHIEVNNAVVSNADFTNSTANRGVEYTIGAQGAITAVAREDTTKQDTHANIDLLVAATDPVFTDRFAAVHVPVDTDPLLEGVTLADGTAYRLAGDIEFLHDVGDVNVTAPAQNDVLEYQVDTADPTQSGWVNRPLSMAQLNLTEVTTTLGTTGTPVRITGGPNNEIDFIAFDVPGSSASVGQFQGIDLYSTLVGTTVTRSLVVNTTNFQTNPTVVATLDAASEAAGLIIRVSGTQVLVSEIPTDTLTTYTATVTVYDGDTTTTPVLDGITRNIVVTDNRGISFLRGATIFDATGGAGYDFAGQANPSTEVVNGQWEVALNNVVIPAFTNASGTIPRDDANWVLGTGNTIRIRGTDTRDPERTFTITRNIDARRPFYFFQSDTEVTQTGDFADPVLEEFSAGRSLTATSSGTWWLAYPQDLGIFQYIIMRSGNVVDPPPSTRLFFEPEFGNRGTTQYTVLEFTGVTNGTVFEVQNPQED